MKVLQSVCNNEMSSHVYRTPITLALFMTVGRHMMILRSRELSAAKPGSSHDPRVLPLINTTPSSTSQLWPLESEWVRARMWNLVHLTILTLGVGVSKGESVEFRCDAGAPLTSCCFSHYQTKVSNSWKLCSRYLISGINIYLPTRLAPGNCKWLAGWQTGWRVPDRLTDYG